MNDRPSDPPVDGDGDAPDPDDRPASAERSERRPLEATTPSAESVLFVLLGAAFAVLVFAALL